VRNLGTMGSGSVVGASIAVILAFAANAAAGEVAEVDVVQDTAEAALNQTASTAPLGAFLPFSQPASIAGQRAYAVGVAGYDSARRAGTFEASAEVRLWGPVAIRGGAVYSNGDRRLRPSFGARVQGLQEGRHGVDGAVGVFYRPEGLTEAEGEIESVLSVGRHAGGTYLLANLLYGQDPEGRERDGEVRLAALRPVTTRFLLGFDGRLRFDLGSDATRLAQHNEPTLDALLGPSATALLGPIALSVQGGGSALRLRQSTSYGAFVAFGVGSAL
jgi:hypothetical protein